MLRVAAIFAMALFSLLAAESKPRAQSAEACGQLAELLGAIEKDADKITNQLARMDSNFGTWCEFGKRTTIPLFEDYLRRIEASRGNSCFGANEQNVIDALGKHLANVRKNVEEDCRRANRATGMQASGATRDSKREPGVQASGPPRNSKRELGIQTSGVMRDGKREPAAQGSGYPRETKRENLPDASTCVAPARRASPSVYRLPLRKNCQPVLAAVKTMTPKGSFSCKTVLLSPSGSIIKSTRRFAPQLLGTCYAGAACNQEALRAAHCRN